VKLSKPAGGLIGLGMVALAGVSAVKVAGTRIRHHHDPELDALFASAGELAHHHLPTADGGELHVVEAGAGRPVVLLHGVTLQWWVWSALISLLRDRYRVVAWDMRGHGESRAGRDGVSLEATASDLAMLLRELDLDDAILVGHSMGGMTLGHFVGRHSDELAARVSALCFVATSGCATDKSFSRGNLKTLYGVAGRALLAGLRRPSPRYPWHDNDLSAVLLRTAFGPSATADMIDAVRRMSADMATASMIEAGNALAAHDVRQVLPFVDMPTTVVVGDADRITPPGHARELAELIPGATLVELEGVGHQIMQESPVALAGIIDDLDGRAPSLVPVA